MGTCANMNVGVSLAPAASSSPSKKKMFPHLHLNFLNFIGNWNKHFQFFMYFIGIHTKMVRPIIVFLHWSVVPHIPEGHEQDPVTSHGYYPYFSDTNQSHSSSSLSLSFGPYPMWGCKSFNGPCFASLSTEVFDGHWSYRHPKGPGSRRAPVWR